MVDYHQLDVTDRASVRALSTFLERANDGVDILVNNAGVLLDPPGSRAQSVAHDNLRATFAVNRYAAIAFSRAFIPAILRRRFGSIVNVSSGGRRANAKGCERDT
jgi:NAD(P)-dependent dehydrogenase (short-subunit alcohol dehydrogenase family)